MDHLLQKYLDKILKKKCIEKLYKPQKYITNLIILVELFTFYISLKNILNPNISYVIYNMYDSNSF